MGKKTTKKKVAQVDEHDQPTEPLPQIVLPPQMNTVPIPLQTPLSPFPYRKDVLSYPAAPNAPKFDVYPYHQPIAEQQSSEPQTPEDNTKSEQLPQPRVRRSFFLRLFPLGIGMCFVCVQLLLLTRFILKLFEVPLESSWVSNVYSLSALFLQPFQAYLPPIYVSWLANVEFYTLLAVFTYGLISRLIVRLLKLMFSIYTSKR